MSAENRGGTFCHPLAGVAAKSLNINLRQGKPKNAVTCTANNSKHKRSNRVRALGVFGAQGWQKVPPVPPLPCHPFRGHP